MTLTSYLDVAQVVMGGIDLDPCVNELVRATRFCRENGLTIPWYGRVWLHPPSDVGLYVEKLVGHWCDRDLEAAIVLVNSATETGWFQLLLSEASMVLFPYIRVSPGGEAGSHLRGQAVFYFGEEPGKFAEAYSDIGQAFVRYPPPA